MVAASSCRLQQGTKKSDGKSTKKAQWSSRKTLYLRLTGMRSLLRVVEIIRIACTIILFYHKSKARPIPEHPSSSQYHYRHAQHAKQRSKKRKKIWKSRLRTVFSRRGAWLCGRERGEVHRWDQRVHQTSKYRNPCSSPYSAGASRRHPLLIPARSAM
jgi:hypothetical protein